MKTLQIEHYFWLAIICLNFSPHPNLGIHFIAFWVFSVNSLTFKKYETWLRMVICGVLFPDPAREDKLIWKANTNGEFSVRSAQELSRCKNPRVSWHKSIWGSFKIPRHNFVSWLAVHNSKIWQIALGRQVNATCVLFGNADEDRDHLFFEYPCSKAIQSYVLLRSGYRRSPGSWSFDQKWVVANLRRYNLGTNLGTFQYGVRSITSPTHHQS